MEKIVQEIQDLINYILQDIANQLKEEKVNLMYEDMIEELEQWLLHQEVQFDNDTYSNWR